MYTIGFDTSHKFLLVVLMDEQKVVDFIQMDCFKQQSEYIISKLDELLKRNHLEIEDVDKIVCTLGPGSYTGVRIGLTVTKVLGSIANKKVYTLSTLQLYAGLKECYVAVDARANRCYVGHYKDGKAVEADCVLNNEQIQNDLLNKGILMIGDLHLFGKEDLYEDLSQHFMDLKAQWAEVDNVDILSPTYLKSSEEYLKK